MLEIIEAVLTTGGEDVAEELMAVFRAFIIKLSPALHLALLDMLKVPRSPRTLTSYVYAESYY